MSDALALTLAIAAGGALGVLFYGGLWRTVSKGIESKDAALWFFGSLTVRMSLTAAGFYFVGRDHWDRALVCLVGFVIARFVVTQLTQSRNEARHAP